MNATANVPGIFSYNPPVGTILATGSQTLTAVFTPTNTTDYTSTTATVTLTVNQATPTITWATPAAITYGTLLSSTQMDATVNVSGSFSYSPAAGTVLPAGTQTLKVTFTPNNTTDYTTASATETLTVNQATPAITWPTSAAITYGTLLSARNWTPPPASPAPSATVRPRARYSQLVAQRSRLPLHPRIPPITLLPTRRNP